MLAAFHMQDLECFSKPRTSYVIGRDCPKIKRAPCSEIFKNFKKNSVEPLALLRLHTLLENCHIQSTDMYTLTALEWITKMSLVAQWVRIRFCQSRAYGFNPLGRFHMPRSNQPVSCQLQSQRQGLRSRSQHCRGSVSRGPEPKCLLLKPGAWSSRFAARSWRNEKPAAVTRRGTHSLQLQKTCAAAKDLQRHLKKWIKCG